MRSIYPLLYKFYYKTSRNLPIIAVGNISFRSEIPIQT